MDKISTRILLEVMLRNQRYFKTGLCAWIMRLSDNNIISFKEEKLLSDYIKTHRPFKYFSKTAWKQRKSAYYWPVEKIEPRIKWIKNHIKKLK